MKEASLYLRVDGSVKQKAQEVLAERGYSMAKALDICLRKLSTGDLSTLEPEETDIVSEYPKGFFDLFGSDKDNTMTVIEDVPMMNDLEDI